MKFLRIICLSFFWICYLTGATQNLTYSTLTDLLKRTSPENTDSLFLIQSQRLVYLEKASDMDEEKARCLNNLAELTLRIGNVVKAEEYSSKATLLAEQKNLKAVISECFIMKGRILYSQNLYDQAMALFRRGVKIATSFGNKKMEAAMLGQIGYVFAKTNMLDSSLTYQQMSMNIKVEMKDTIAIASSCSNLGYIYFLKDDLVKARDYYYKAAEIRKNLNDPFMKAASIMDCATAEKNWAMKQKV